MSFKKKFVLISVVLLMSTTFFLNSPSTYVKPVKAWSGDTHGWLSEVAIRLMPEPWSTNLMEELQFFYDHSREPDTIRGNLAEGSIGYAQEEPRHYIDADVRPELYGNATHHPQPVFSTVKNLADPRESSDYQLGVASWAAENWTLQLAEDLQLYSWDSETVLMDMCMAAHYVQDSWMPFHAVSYYDGQQIPSTGDDIGLFYKGGQSGIHGYTENTLIQQLYADEVHAILDSVSGSARYVVPYMASLRGIQSGQVVADELLDVVDVHGYTFGTSQWINAMWDLSGGTNGNYTKRLINASFETANVWYTAFVDAGLIEDTTTTTTTQTTTTTTDESTISSTTTTTTKTSPGFNYIVALITLIMPIWVYKLRRKQQ